MKKPILTLLTVLAIVLGALGLSACGDLGSLDNLLSLDAIKQIAETDLGAALAGATFTSTKVETDGGTKYYDLEFVLDGVKYEYKVNAVTGDVAKVEINDQTVDTATKPVTPSAENAEYIGIDAAKELALQDAGISAENAAFVEQKLDFDNGFYLYEITFVSAGVKYEYEIKAADGAIYEKDVDGISVTAPASGTEGDYVGIEAAKSTAFLDASTTADAVTLKKAKFDVDNGVHVYEIVFMLEGREYDYEINAKTGAILEREVDGVKVLTVPASGSTEYIGLEAAKEIALRHAGFSLEAVTFTEAKLDVDRGVYAYEIEFIADGFEYEYEIHATNGSVIEVDRERV